jgi:transposase
LHGPERRRRWSADEEARIVAESFEPTVVSLVALRHGLHRNQLHAWRRELQEAGCNTASVPGMSFAPVVLTDTAAPARSKDIEITLGGAVVRVGAGADLGLVCGILRLLKQSA